MGNEQPIAPCLNVDLSICSDYLTLSMLLIVFESALILCIVVTPENALSFHHIITPLTFVPLALPIEVSADPVFLILLPLAHIQLPVVIEASAESSPHIRFPFPLILVVSLLIPVCTDILTFTFPHTALQLTCYRK